MKKISTELTKNYIYILSLVLVIFFIPLYYIAKYQYSYSRQEIYSSLKFLEREFSEEENRVLTPEKLYDIFNEIPEVGDLSIYILHKDKFFTKNNSDIPDFLLTLPSNRKIKLFKNQYWFLHKTLKSGEGKNIEVFLIKDLNTLFSFYEQLFGAFGTALILLICLCIYIMKKFYKSFIPQLEFIQKKADSINLNSLDLKTENMEFYSEFTSILISYENMIKRLQKQSEIQKDFVNNVSHELKTPIFIIKSYSKLIKKYFNSDKELLVESVEALTSEVNNMEKLIEKLLFLSRIDYQNTTKEEVDLTELVEDVIQEITIFNPKQIVNFKSYITPCTINSNWVLCKQVVRNIVDNAVKYGNNNPVNIEIIEDNNHEFVTLTVKDSGVGIKEEELPLIFDKFYRIGGSRSEEGKGHGLGLSIVKSILDVLDGKISVSSIYNQETTFTIKLKK